ncbi:MAG: outer membrane beta-barrel protein [Bacteroidia bacterium]
MKKIILSLLVFASVATQAQSFEKGQLDFNVGMGLGNTFIGYGRYVGAGYAYTRMPVINASGEYGITDAVSIGGYLGYTSFKYSWTYNDYNPNNGTVGTYVDSYKWSFFILGARGSYHFGQFIKVDKLDCYAGLMTGYNIAKATYTTTDPYHSSVYTVGGFGGFAWSIYGGARYRFTDHIGVYGELGYGVSILNIGLNIKL